MRRGVAPSLFPTAGTTFPLDTLLFNASLFSFSRGVAYSLPPSRYACHLPHGGRPLKPPSERGGGSRRLSGGSKRDRASPV